MRRVASPVVVVIAEPASGTPRGATIGSFTSVALDPPLVSFNVARGTRIHGTLSSADRFAVHLLAHDQADVAAHFADPALDGERQLSAYRPAEASAAGGSPLIPDSLGMLVCRIESRLEAGDHTVIVGRVVDVLPGRDAPPLVYHRQEYGTVKSGGGAQ